MKSQNQLKYFLNTNVGTYGITKDNIATCVVVHSVCLHQIFKLFGFSRSDSFYLFSPPNPQIFGITRNRRTALARWVWPGGRAVGDAYPRDSCFCAVRPCWLVSRSLRRSFIPAAGTGLGGTHLFLSSIATTPPPARTPGNQADFK